MKQADSILTGVQQLLFGRFRPDEVVVRFEHGDSDLCHTLHVMPSSPKSYLQTDKHIHYRWGHRVNDKLMDNWIAPWYRLPESDPKSFHILCEFYRIYICCECRMMIQAAESLINDFSLNQSLIIYELLTLQQELTELIKECHKRESDHAGNKETSHTLESRLHAYLNELMNNHLMMIFLEIQKRYGHMLGDRVITLKNLCLKHLQQSLPDRFSWYGTEELTLFELEWATRPPGSLGKIKTLLEKQGKLIDQQTNEAARTTMYSSLKILENAWLSAFAATNSEAEIEIDICDHKVIAERIGRWTDFLKGNGKPDDDDTFALITDVLLKKAAEIKATLKTGRTEHCSEAVLFIKELEAIFTPADKTALKDQLLHFNDGKDSEEHWLLKMYVPYLEVESKFSVNRKTFKKYVRQSGISVIELSAKNRWMHVDDIKTLMNNHRVTF